MSSRERWFKWLKIVGVGAGSLSFGFVVAIWFSIRHYESQLPSVDRLKHGYDPPQVTRVLARDGTVLASLYTERRTLIPFSEVPRHVKLAFLAAEDANFYEHEGLDYVGMLRALVANLRAGKTRQGASTITQQVIKNVMLDPERTYERKVKETILARRLEQSLTKDEIFGLYLNHIYLGHGRYGIEEAARYYFGKKAKDLDLPEGAVLAGLVASPERFSPRNDREKSLFRRSYVLKQMLEKGFVTQEVYDGAIDAALYLEPASEGESDLIPEIIPEVKALLEQVAGERARRGGYTVHTTIDPELEASARRAVRENLDQYQKRHDLLPPFTVPSRKSWPVPPTTVPKAHRAYTGLVQSANDADATLEVAVGPAHCKVSLKNEERFNPTKLRASEFARVGAALRVSFPETPKAGTAGSCQLALGPESALVALDARTREVLALVGSYEALPGGLDWASHALRQPGSAFKGVLYSYALHSRRFTPSSILELPPKPPDPKRKEASPEPEGPRKLSLRLAVAKSDNDAAARVLEESGAPNVVNWAKALGIKAELKPTPSLALGAYEVTPIELVTAYAVFASGGEYDAPHLVTKIVGPDHRELPLPEAAPKRRVMTPEEAYLTTSLLKGVVEVGTGVAAKVLGRPLAGKTGTTNDAKDTWFVGYSTDVVAGVWVGFDDPQPLGWAEQGARTALPAWIAFMKAAHQKRPATDFPRPSGIIVASVDPATGLLPRPGQEDAVEEEFLEGTAPEQVAPEAAPEADAGAPDAGGDEELATVSTVPPTEALPDPPSQASDAGTEAEPPPPF